MFSPRFNFPRFHFLGQGGDESAQTISYHDKRRRSPPRQFSFSYFKNTPKSRLYRAIRQGDVRANQKKAGADYRLKVGDILEVRGLKTEPTDLQKQKAPAIPGQKIAELEQAILYEDEDLLVLNKPAGLSVHKGTGVEYGLIETLQHLRPDCKDLELIHRLDKPTSVVC